MDLHEEDTGETPGRCLEIHPIPGERATRSAVSDLFFLLVQEPATWYWEYLSGSIISIITRWLFRGQKNCFDAVLLGRPHTARCPSRPFSLEQGLDLYLFVT